jgi:ribosome-binding ATPase YchF (GTP1/OBG family)
METAEEREMFLQDIGLHEPGVNKLIHAAYRLLKLADLLHRRGARGPRLDHPSRRYGTDRPPA